jgi:small subunit ribosomal protein S3Ae
MAIGKSKRTGRKGGKRKTVIAMSRKEWYDVVAPTSFATRQFSKTLCNKTIGTKLAVDNLKGRVYEACLADLDDNKEGDRPFRKIKLRVDEVQGRNALTQFYGLDTTTDKLRSLVRKWCTTIECVTEAKLADGHGMRLFVIAFTRKQEGQHSKNCYAKTRLVDWIRSRMNKMILKRLAKCDINQATKLITQDTLVDAIAKRCNPIFPLRDVKIRRVKVLRFPKFELGKLLDAHGTIPASSEEAAVGREVEVAAE